MSNSSRNGSDGNDRREVRPILETSDDLHSNLQFRSEEHRRQLVVMRQNQARLVNRLQVETELYEARFRTLEGILNRLDALEENQNGLQEENLEKLVVTVYSETQAAISSAVGEKTMCLICHENYKDGDLIVRLHCNHIFCKNCLFTWLKSNKTCPCCRDDVMRHLKQ